MVEIRLLELKDCQAVAESHVKYLQTPFRGNAGIQILKVRYEAITNRNGGIGFVALDDGVFAGFVCGIWDSASLYRTLLKNWGNSLLLSGIKYVLQSPKVILGFLHRMLNPHTSGIIKLEGYELRPIVVLPDHRGRGIAEQLTQRVLEDAKERGYREVFLFTEGDNVRAAKFYTKFGFNFERDLHMGGNTYKLFRYHLSSDGVQQ
jgi:GNAT superfamily N-acetyltransferase